MKWAGHMVRLKDERFPKRTETKKRGGCRKRGRPELRWEDCWERDLKNYRKMNSDLEKSQRQMEENNNSEVTSEL